MHTDPTTGEISERDLTTHDEHGRPWGKPLWEGGPINGGVDWRTWVPAMLAARDERFANRARGGR